jgi:hypothetical protein
MKYLYILLLGNNLNAVQITAFNKTNKALNLVINYQSEQTKKAI